MIIFVMNASTSFIILLYNTGKGSFTFVLIKHNRFFHQNHCPLELLSPYIK